MVSGFDNRSAVPAIEKVVESFCKGVVERILSVGDGEESFTETSSSVLFSGLFGLYDQSVWTCSPTKVAHDLRYF
jgi:hypothetical protein